MKRDLIVLLFEKNCSTSGIPPPPTRRLSPLPKHCPSPVEVVATITSVLTEHSCCESPDSADNSQISRFF